jgi:hypothetical protein
MKETANHYSETGKYLTFEDAMLSDKPLLSSFAAEGVVSVDVVLMMSAGTRCPVWVDREAQFAADVEEESQWGETIFDAAARHCNERV